MNMVVSHWSANAAVLDVVAAVIAVHLRGLRGARMSVLAVVAFNVAWCGWHLPVLYDGALRHPVVYAAEVVSYLGLGVALWLQLIGSRPVSPVLAPLCRVTLLAGTPAKPAWPSRSGL
jgi:cytochrome c oxidase assembly factor CtaG